MSFSTTLRFELIICNMNINISGLLPSCIKYLKELNATSQHELFYALSLDEVSIRKQIVYDGKEMRGYVDYGGIDAKGKERLEATDALFVMAATINGSSKVPIAYVLTNGSDADLLSAVMKKAMEVLHEAGGRALPMTMDGLPANLAAEEQLQLGANFDVSSENFRTYMNHPTTKLNVYFFPDPCHMFKLARNALQAYGTFLDQDNNVR